MSLPFKMRLKAWWKGYDPAEVARLLRERQPHEAPRSRPVPPPLPPGAVAPEDIDLPFDPWDAQRIEIAQYVWGEGFCGPGGPDHIVSMSKLLALSPEMSLLEIGSYLGGPARTLAEKFGAWVTGFEESPRLVDLANQKSLMTGLAKKAEIHVFDPNTLEKFDRKYDRAFAKETFFTIEKKAKLLGLLEEHLKPGGLFLITDFVLASESVVATYTFNAWRDCETARRRPYMVTAKELADMCKKARFTVRVDEDVSKDYIDLVNKAWAGADRVAARIGGQADSEALLRTLLKEAEFWNLRVSMLESGQLQLRRLVGSKRAEKPSMMSDW